jgi:4-carboxymuconolactone decarboxylase
VSDQERKLRCLAMNDQSEIASLLGLHLETQEASGLDPKSYALVRLGAIVAIGAAPVTYQWATEAALSAGASDDEIIGTLVTVAPVVGTGRVVAAAPDIAISLGYPVETALEALNAVVDGPGDR